VLGALHQCLCRTTPLGISGLLRLAHHHTVRHVVYFGVHMNLSPSGGPNAAQVLRG